jgi:hypothetical protein
MELGWTDTEIFGIGDTYGRGLLCHLAIHGARLCAVTDQASWIESTSSCRQRYRRNSLGRHARPLWKLFVPEEMDNGR